MIINVKDFGAKGDGMTDDTTAIQAAIDYGDRLAKLEKVREAAQAYVAIDCCDFTETQVKLKALLNALAACE